MEEKFLTVTVSTGSSSALFTSSLLNLTTKFNQIMDESSSIKPPSIMAAAMTTEQTFDMGVTENNVDGGGGVGGSVPGGGPLLNKSPTIIIYSEISPESIVIPIVSCILGFPLLALFVICCLRRRAKLARERERRRNYDLQDHSISLVQFSPIHRLSYPSKAVRLRSERSLSRGFPSLELDTVLEERNDSDPCQMPHTILPSPETPSTSS